jgi:hypothetical protein
MEKGSSTAWMWKAGYVGSDLVAGPRPTGYASKALDKWANSKLEKREGQRTSDVRYLEHHRL